MGITIISTGGTIAMSLDADGTQQVPQLTARELVGDAAADVEFLDLYAIPSQDTTLARMVELAQRIEACVAAGRRVVVTHGTDTLEEVSYFVAEVAGNPDCVFTAAMRPSDAISADGPRNVRDAITAARHLDGHGVVACMNRELVPAYAVVKSDSVSQHAFMPRFGGALGRVHGNDVQVLGRAARANWLAPGASDARLDGGHVGVPIIDLGCDPEPSFVARMLATVEGGCIVKGLGAGQLPAHVRALLLELAARTSVVLTSRCFTGPVTDAEAYPGSWNDLLAAGIVLEESLDPYKARIRLAIATRLGRPYEPFVLEG